MLNQRIRAAGLLGLVGAVLLASAVIASRHWFETPNFKPVGAACLLAPFLFTRCRGWAWSVPIWIVLGSEWLLKPSAGTLVMPLVLSWLINVWIGQRLADWVWPVGRLKSPRLGWFASLLACTGATLLASLQFYLVTNVWVWAGAGWYDRSMQGLLHCLAAGIPFFRLTLQADVCFGLLPLAAIVLIRSLLCAETSYRLLPAPRHSR